MPPEKLDCWLLFCVCFFVRFPSKKFAIQNVRDANWIITSILFIQIIQISCFLSSFLLLLLLLQSPRCFFIYIFVSWPSWSKWHTHTHVRFICSLSAFAADDVDSDGGGGCYFCTFRLCVCCMCVCAWHQIFSYLL